MHEHALAVKLASPALPVTPTVRATSLLHQVATLLQNHLETGEAGSIDIGRTPLSPAERRRLEEVLGFGEVEARIESKGLTVVREAGVPGVWWLDYHDGSGAAIARFIEITEVPEMLRTSAYDMKRGLTRLKGKLEQVGDSERVSGTV
jgi:hydrogenase-1 operon protein HyaF